MQKDGYRQHFELEDTFWWFVCRRKAIQSFLAPFSNGTMSLQETGTRQMSILDVGCGTGGMFQLFERYGRLWGVDYSPEAISYCKRRNRTGRLIQGSALQLPFPEERFDLVMACDLLSHRGVEDDLTALKELHRVCKKERYLLLTESAFSCLRGSHDRYLDGVRRYTKKILGPKVEKSGFVVERMSYMNMTLFPVAFLWRNLRRHAKGSDLKPIPPSLNRFLTWFFSGEATLLERWSLPFGTSLLCLAKKLP